MQSIKLRGLFRVRPILLLASMLLATPSVATNPVTEIATGDIAAGTLGLGFGWRWGDSPYKGIDDISSKETDESSDLLPFYFYEGKFLFSHGSSAGVHLFDGGAHDMF